MEPLGFLLVPVVTPLKFSRSSLREVTWVMTLDVLEVTDRSIR